MYSLFEEWPRAFSNIEYVQKVCTWSPSIVVKTIRIDLDVVEKLLNDRSVGNSLKVIHLVRDPRGILSSRKTIVGFQNSKASDICSDMRKNLAIYNRLQHSTHKHKLLQIRYEDLASKPISTLLKVWNFTGFSFKNVDLSHLRKHIFGNGKKRPPASSLNTEMNSLNTYKEWLKNAKFELVEEAQEHCNDVMKSIGYKLLNSSMEMNPSFNPILD